jgi:hypothetical protein
MNSDNHFYRAAIKSYEAQREEAIATLELYFQHSVGIADHSNILATSTWTHFKTVHYNSEAPKIYEVLIGEELP